MSDDSSREATAGLTARLRPGLEAQHPSLGPHWYLVRERNDTALQPEPGPGHVWLQVGHRLRLLPAELFEFCVTES